VSLTRNVLVKALKDIGLADGRPYDKALVDRAEQELKRQYINRSMYATEVVTTVTPIERNRVNLSFAVSEGEPATITDIRIVGAKAFPEATLLGLFDLNTGSWLSWYTKSNRYARPKLNADIETLRSYYLTRGYLEFRVESTQVAIAPDKQSIGITINVTEGERFVVSRIKLAGNYLDKEAEFQFLDRHQGRRGIQRRPSRADYQSLHRLLRQFWLRLRPRGSTHRHRPRHQPG